MLSLLLAALPQDPVWNQISPAMVSGQVLYPRGAAGRSDQIVMIAEGGGWVTEDGKRWVKQTGPAEMPGDPPMGHVVGFDNKVWVIGSRSRADGQPNRDVWFTGDGIRWVHYENALPTAGARPYADESGLWLFGAPGQSWKSRNGVDWTAMPKSNFTNLIGAANLNNVVFGFGATGEVWKTDPGAKWVKLTSKGPWVNRWRPAFASAAGRLWMIGGSDKRDYATSTDGITWQVHPLPKDWFPRAAVQLVPWKNGILVFGGKSGHARNSNPQDVWFVHLPE